MTIATEADNLKLVLSLELGMTKRTLRLSVPSFFVNDLIKQIDLLGEQIGVTIEMKKGKGFHAYPLTLIITGHPDKILPTVHVIESLREEHHFSIIMMT